MTPEAAASAAREACAKKLALFHFDPGKYPTLDSRQEAGNAAKAIFKDTIAANDGTIIEI
jgi:ribonuclease BN (tRNA processing enzyme)